MKKTHLIEFCMSLPHPLLISIYTSTLGMLITTFFSSLSFNMSSACHIFSFLILYHRNSNCLCVFFIPFSKIFLFAYSIVFSTVFCRPPLSSLHLRGHCSEITAIEADWSVADVVRIVVTELWGKYFNRRQKMW